MTDEQSQEVTSETTDPAASAGDQTQPTTDAPVDNAGTEGVDDKVIPYSRFKEKVDEANELKARLDKLEAERVVKPTEIVAPQVDPETQKVQETIAKLGFVSRQELEQMNQIAREDMELDKTFATLEAKYDGSDGRPKFSRKEIIDYYVKSDKVAKDPEVLYKLKHEKELTNWAIQQASKNSTGVKSEVSDGSGSKNTGTDLEDLRKAAMSGSQEDRLTYLKRITFGK